MKRIMVIGNMGTGKSTFARQLHNLTHLDLYYLDKYFFKTRTEYISGEEWKEIVYQLAQKDSWIIDGTYPSTFLIRAERADTIFILDLPIFYSYFNMIRRTIRNFIFNNQRDDSPLFKYDRFDCDTLKRIWRFNRKKNKYYFEIFAMNNKTIYHFKTYKEIKEYIENFQNKNTDIVPFSYIQDKYKNIYIIRIVDVINKRYFSKLIYKSLLSDKKIREGRHECHPNSF